jgi:DHA3 family macrolide efflux protein-like MFS transporter
MAGLSMKRLRSSRVTYTGLIRGHADLRRLWLGSGVSQFGDAVQGIAVLWLATRGAAIGLPLGLVSLALFAPPVIVGPFAGVLADRLHRRRILIGSDLLRVVTAAALPLVYVTFGLPAVDIVIVIHSTLSTLFGAAYNAALPEVAGPERVVTANGLMQVTGYLAGVAGAGAGGVLVATTPMALPFLVNAATFAWSARMSSLVTPRLLATGAEGGERTSYLASLRAGLVYVRSERPVFLYAVIGLVATFGFAPAPVTIVALVKLELHADSAGYGLIQVAIILGFAAGAGLAGRLVTRSNAVPVMAAGYLGMAVGTAIFGQSTSIWLAILVMVVRGGCNGVLLVSGVSIIQLLVPNEYRGRVFTLVESAQELPRLAILPLAGVLMDMIGIRTIFTVMSIFIGMAGVIALIAAPALRGGTADQAPSEPGTAEEVAGSET